MAYDPLGKEKETHFQMQDESNKEKNAKRSEGCMDRTQSESTVCKRRGVK